MKLPSRKTLGVVINRKKLQRLRSLMINAKTSIFALFNLYILSGLGHKIKRKMLEVLYDNTAFTLVKMCFTLCSRRAGDSNHNTIQSRNCIKNGFADHWSYARLEYGSDGRFNNARHHWLKHFSNLSEWPLLNN
ncbi:hypothetical protein KIN20_010640 [Parelaphostrongylus tenuis]|uniref:Uncharacterized protein n=1 Tax=Parelaphostrongylus tenuis TaxID=148309 RepID=A0AAD5MS58_PARTN|nr:hypothetical protein KIN20_010640 [Parelaphostrongylus tenuis]